MPSEPFLENPISIHKRRAARRSRHRRNPFGEMLIVGSNPKSEERGDGMRRYHRRRRVHHNPKRRRHHARYMVVGRKYSHNPRRRRHHRSYRRNPMIGGASVSFKSLMPMTAGFLGGVIAVDALPTLIGRFMPSLATGYMVYAMQGASVFAAQWVGKKVGGKQVQMAVIAGGVGKMIYNFIGGYIISMITSIAPAATATATSGFGALDYRGMGMMAEDDM